MKDSTKLLIAGSIGYMAGKRTSGKPLTIREKSTEAGLITYAVLDSIDPENKLLSSKNLRNSTLAVEVAGLAIMLTLMFNDVYDWRLLLSFVGTLIAVVYAQTRKID